MFVSLILILATLICCMQVPSISDAVIWPHIVENCQGIHWAYLCQCTNMFTFPFSHDQLMHVVIVDVSFDGVAAVTSTVKASRRTEALDASSISWYQTLVDVGWCLI